MHTTAHRPHAIPLVAGVLSGSGVVLTPAVGALFMSLSTMIVAINARFLRLPSSWTASRGERDE